MNFNNLTKEEISLIDRIESNSEAGEVLSTLNTVGFWVKDMQFRFLKITDEASKILYGRDPAECHKKTDFDLAKESGMAIDKDIFAKVCRGSDLYILSNAKKGIYQDTMFIELLTSTEGEKHIWQTTKGIKPQAEGFGTSYWGNAVFLDKLLGYENALECVKNMKNLEKINNNLFVYKK